MKRDLIKFVSAMVITALVSALALSKVYLATSDEIAARSLEVQENARKAIFPSADFFRDDSVDGLVYQKAYSNSEFLGYLFIAQAPAYSSVISTMAGVDKNFTIKGIAILHQNETPGLGARIEEVQGDRYIWQFYKKNDTVTPRRPWFQEQFIGLSALNLNLGKMNEWRNLTEKEKEQFRLNNTVSTISGATISAEAVRKSVKDAATILKQGVHKKDSASSLLEETENSEVQQIDEYSLNPTLSEENIESTRQLSLEGGQ